MAPLVLPEVMSVPSSWATNSRVSLSGFDPGYFLIHRNPQLPLIDDE